MDEQDFILKIMQSHGELPKWNRLSPDYEYCTIELQTRDMKDVFVMTITKKKSCWKGKE